MKKISSQKILKYLIILLETVGFLILAYLLLFPFYPALVYKFSYSERGVVAEQESIEIIKKETKEFRNDFPASEYSISPNRLIISKIGVNAPIVESTSEQYGLSKGSWRVPESSTPDKGGNTVLTGHRFKYFPPNNLTFYLFDKLAIGDLVSIIWKDKDYLYKVKETKIVPATEVSIMNPSDKPIITMFTCDPIYSTKNRLVVIAELIK